MDLELVMMWTLYGWLLLLFTIPIWGPAFDWIAKQYGFDEDKK